MHRIVKSAALALMVPTTSLVHAQPAWEFSTGADYSVGAYGETSDTTIFRIPFGMKMQADRLRGELVASYLHLKGPSAVAGVPGAPIIAEPGAGGMAERSGLGDTTVSAAYAFYRSADGMSAIEAGGIVKIPTAEPGLGTGKTDFTSLLNFHHSLTPVLTLSGAAGYQWLGDFEDFGLKDGIVGNLGVNIRASDATSVGGAVNYRQQPWKGIDEQISVNPYVSHRVGERWGVTVYGTVGLTDASPRLGTGMRLSLFQ